MGSGRRILEEEVIEMSTTDDEIRKSVNEWMSIPVPPLPEEGWLSPPDWGRLLGISRDIAYRRLRVMEEEGEVEKTKEGTRIYYRAKDPEMRKKIMKLWSDYLKSSEK